MPTIIYKTVYTFAELLEKEKAGEVTGRAMDRVREWLGEAGTDDSFWYGCIVEEWEEALSQIGFTEPKIYFSGFSHQGQGAAFDSGIDRHDLISFLSTPVEASKSADGMGGNWKPWLVHKAGGVRFNPKFARLLLLTDYIELDNETRGNYCRHGNCPTDYKVTSDLRSYHREPKRISALLEELTETAEELRSDLCHAIYENLESEYDYRLTDEAMLEMAEANGFTFTLQGEREG